MSSVSSEVEDFPICELAKEDFPRNLLEIPQPPKKLNYRGRLPSDEIVLLSVVGSRKYTSYGKQVVDELLSGLKGFPVGIVSGLALGIDSLAHEAAIKNGLYTLAIPGGGLDNDKLYPASHKPLAYKIMSSGGGLLSEFEPDFKATKWSFPKRNRLVCGISRATILIEAAEKSGTLITARMTADYNRELMVVPGSIFSTNSAGVHQFLKLGATPVTKSADILEVLGFGGGSGIEQTRVAGERLQAALQPPLSVQPPFSLSLAEQKVWDLLTEPTHRDELTRKLQIPVNEAAQILTMMEISDQIVNNDNVFRRRG